MLANSVPRLRVSICRSCNCTVFLDFLLLPDAEQFQGDAVNEFRIVD